MSVAIKAVVFKTAQLKETRQFFESILKLTIEESSVRHFVIFSKGIRVVFIESLRGFEMEIYVKDTSATAVKTYNDPNGITIVVT